MAEIQQDYDILYERSSEGVITSLKPDKAGGLDYLHTSQVEHLKYGSNSLMLGIQQVCNAIVELEVIPNVLKMGLWFQFTKRPNRHKTAIVHGVTLSPVLYKTLELLLLGCLQTILSAPVFPHWNQTGFVKKMYCTDAIFS